MPAKPGQYADGDALFRNALLTVCKSDAPRDGGVQIGVFADWLREQLGQSPWLCLHDHDGTGFTLLAAKTGVDLIRIGVVDLEKEEASSSEFLEKGLNAKLTESLRWFWD